MWSALISVRSMLAAALIWAQGLASDCDFSCSVNSTTAAAGEKCIAARWVGDFDATKFAVNSRVV